MKLYNFSLAVRDETGTVYNSSIEWGLAYYLWEEILEKDNKYDCP